MTALKTQGEVESQISTDISKLYVDLFSRGPRHIQVSMLPTSAVLLIQNNFTAAEKQVLQAKTFFDEAGRRMFKDMRAHMMSTNRPALTGVIEGATGVVVTSMHHDISTLTGEEAFVFSLREKPAYKANHNGKMRTGMLVS
jgi:uncharacterized protein YbcI